MTRRLGFVVGFAIAHAIVTIAVGAVALGVAMSGFEPGTLPAAVSTQRFWYGFSAVLLFPLGTLASATGWTPPGPWGYVTLLINGAVWAVALRFAARRLRTHSTDPST